MEDTKTENLNSSNENVGGGQDNSEVTNQDVKILDTEALKEQNRQLFERAKKAEGLVKELKSKIPEEKPKAAESNEPNYGRLAFLQTKGIDHPDDVKVIEDEASRLKLSLTDVIGMEYIKARLQTNKDARNAQAGMPPGSSRTGGATQHDVDYWVEKGGLPEDNQELAEKVVEARMKADSSQRRYDPIR